jgi:ATP-dependent RNA helicase DHX29
MPETPEEHPPLVDDAAASSSDDSDDSDDDPDQLTDKFLSYHHEILKSSLTTKSDSQEQRTANKRSQKLRGRIQKIERDILFDRDEALIRWDQMKRELEIESARSRAMEARHNQSNAKHTSSDDHSPGEKSESDNLTGTDDDLEGDSFGCMFTSNENDSVDASRASSKTIMLREFRPSGAGASPRKVLDDLCKAR